MVLIADSIVRGEWAEKIANPKVRATRRILYGVVACLCFAGFGYWIFTRLHAQNTQEAVASSSVAQPRQPTEGLTDNFEQGMEKKVAPTLDTKTILRPRPTRQGNSPATQVPPLVPSQPPVTQDCAGGNCAVSVGQQGGITAGQITLGGAPPPVYTFTEEVVSGGTRPQIKVHVRADRAVRGAIVGILFSGPIDYLASNTPVVPNAGISQQNWGQLQNSGAPVPNSLFVAINDPAVFLPNQELVVPVTSAVEVHVVRVFPVQN